MKKAAQELTRIAIITLGGDVVMDKFCPKGYFMVRIGGRNYVVKSTVEELEELVKADKIMDYTVLDAWKIN